MAKKKIKGKFKIAVILVCAIVCLIIFLISLIKIINWKRDSDGIKNQEKKIQKIVTIEEKEDTSNTEIIESSNIDHSDPYWDYIKVNMINVDFSELKKVNPDTKGWIQVQGTNINYPFVQAKDNEFYLNHAFDQSNNNAGWVFLDYRNNINELQKNNIIYAHGRLDNTLFGTLKNILSSSWIKNSTNYIIKMSTETENTLWQVFSIYQIETTSDYLKTEFYNDNEFVSFTEKLRNRSAYDFNTSTSKDDILLTLSTCYNKNEKVVLHAKLIKREKRNT